MMNHRIRELRLALNLSHYGFACELGFKDPRIVSYYESGKRKPRIKTLELMIEIAQTNNLDYVDMNWLFGMD